MNNASVVELFRTCVGGSRDDRAWGEFVLTFQPLLRARVVASLRRFDWRAEPELVEDLVQDVYCRLLEPGSRGFRGSSDGEVMSYLRRVCESVVVDRQRGRSTYKRGGRARFVDFDIDSPSLAEVLADGGANPEERCLDRELRSVLLEGCRRPGDGRTGPRNRAIFELAVLDGWTSREIAEGFACGLKPASIDSVVHRHRKRLERRGLGAPPR